MKYSPTALVKRALRPVASAAERVVGRTVRREVRPLAAALRHQAGAIEDVKTLAADRLPRETHAELEARVMELEAELDRRTIDLDTYVADARHGLAAAARLGASLRKAPSNEVAISVPEICAVEFALTYMRPDVTRVAELGTFTGHTARLLAELSPAHTTIEIYDLFEHNAWSRQSLRDHPAYDPDDFYEVWRHTTKAYAGKFAVHRGDLNETKGAVNEPLDLLFVDIVKHESLVNTVVDPFYDRLRVGGFLMHQDYYHWQSPWIVYQMELLDGPFALVGDFGNNMSVYVKIGELTDRERDFDYVDGLGFEEKYRLFDAAVDRYPGLRAGNLLVSKLRLSLGDPNFDSEGLQREILDEFSHNERISRYAAEVMRMRDGISSTMW